MSHARRRTLFSGRLSSSLRICWCRCVSARDCVNLPLMVVRVRACATRRGVGAVSRRGGSVERLVVAVLSWYDAL